MTKDTEVNVDLIIRCAVLYRDFGVSVGTEIPVEMQSQLNLSDNALHRNVMIITKLLRSEVKYISTPLRWFAAKQQKSKYVPINALDNLKIGRSVEINNRDTNDAQVSIF